MRCAVICDSDSAFGDALAILIRGAVNGRVHLLRYSSIDATLAHPLGQRPEVVFLDAALANEPFLRELTKKYGGGVKLVGLEQAAKQRIPARLEPYFLTRADRAAPLAAICTMLLMVFSTASRLQDGNAARDEASVADATRQLTPRQKEVLELIEAGYRNAEIAKQLNISTHTARLHVSAILRALDVSNRTEAAHALNRHTA
jgi:DNA-binding CsgD family transcriptional regulator